VNCLDELSKVQLQYILNLIVFESLVLLESIKYYCCSSVDRSLDGRVSIFVCGMLIVIRMTCCWTHHCLALSSMNE
jgi:hypothetical protein